MSYHKPIIGRKVRIIIPHLVLDGLVIDETKNLFVLRDNKDKIHNINKNNCVLIIDKKEVQGACLIGRIEERIKK